MGIDYRLSNDQELRELFIANLRNELNIIYKDFSRFSKGRAIYLVRKSISEILGERNNIWEEEKVYKINITEQELLEIFEEATEGGHQKIDDTLSRGDFV